MGDFNVLYVDDDRDYLKMIKVFIENEGISVYCAQRGYEALRVFKERAFDLIITDFNMPCMDGLELARSIRILNRMVPIIMVTGSSLPHHRLMERDALISSVLAKPLNLKSFLSLIREEKEKKTWRLSTSVDKIEPRYLSYGYWSCPKCHASYQGWSPLDLCSKCSRIDYELNVTI